MKDIFHVFRNATPDEGGREDGDSVPPSQREAEPECSAGEVKEQWGH